MRDESPDEADDSIALLARKKMWNRRLLVVILSATLTLVACKFLGMRFASAEQVMLTLLLIAMIALLLRIFRSKGRFRFASLLLLTAFCSVVFRVVLQPLKRLSAQNAAMELLNRKGGSVVTYAGMERYPQNAHGWVQSDSGYLYPALLAYLEKKYLHPVDVMSLKIPSSLINKEMWNSLNCKQVSRVEVLLDGSDDGKEFSQILSGIPHFFVEWDHYFFRRLVFVANNIRPSDIQFLNGMRWGGVGREMPVIHLGPDSHIEPKLLEELEAGFELIHEGLVGDPAFLDSIFQVRNLKRISMHNLSLLEPGLQSISKRSQALESLQLYNCNIDAESWPLLCELNNCRSLRLSQIRYQGPPMAPEILQQLGQNQSIQELVLYLDAPQASAIPALMKIQGLSRLVVHCDATCDAELLSAIRDSTIQDIWLDMEPVSESQIQWNSWMERMQSIRIGNKRLVAPK